MDYEKRITALRSKLQEKKLGALISSHLPTIRYLCGFSGSHSVIVVTTAGSFFLTDFRYKEQIQTEVTADKKFICKGNLFESKELRSILLPLQHVGFEKDHLSVAGLLDLQKKSSGKKFVPTEGMVEDLCGIKDDDELTLIKKAVDISDIVFQKILGMIKPGISELELSAEISYYHKKFGAENDAFDTILATGIRGALPHGRASDKKIREGEFVTLDFGCIYQGYHSDMTRTVCVGRPSAEMKSVYSIVLTAQTQAISAMRKSVAAKKIDSIARHHIASKGYGKFFGHSLGHGVGLEIHEHLRLSQASKDRLFSGNVVTVEPGIYLPGKFGVRIEDMVVVRNTGCEILTSSPKELIIL